MRAQSTGGIVYLYYVPTWRHDIRTTRSVAILEAPGCISTSGIAPGLWSLCVCCTHRMLLPQLCGLVSAIVVCIPGKSHAFLLSLSLSLSLSHFISLFPLSLPFYINSPQFYIFVSVVVFLACRQRRLTIYIIVARANFVNLYWSGTRGCFNDDNKKRDYAR